MTASFILTVAGKKIRADLLEQEAPRITRAFKKNLPVKSFGVNAKFAGDESIVMLPFYEEPEPYFARLQKFLRAHPSR